MPRPEALSQWERRIDVRSRASSLRFINTITEPTMPEATQGRVSTATFTPAAAAYSAGDVLEGKKEFSNIGPILGGAVIINSAELMISETALQASEAGYTLHLYGVTPPSNLADNAVFDVPAGDRAAYLGSI